MNQTNIAASGKLISKEIIAVMLGMMLLVSPLCRAAEHPEIVVRALFHELLTELQTHREADTLTHDNVREVFSIILNPRIDYTALSNWILRDKWTNSSAEQQRQFMDAFQAYIINTYSLALAGKQKISMDVRDGPRLRKNTAIVTADFAIEDADPIPIDFRLIERDDKWLLFDVSFTGVSLAITFRSDFNYIAKDGGIDAVTAHLIRRASGRTGNPGS